MKINHLVRLLHNDQIKRDIARDMSLFSDSMLYRRGEALETQERLPDRINAYVRRCESIFQYGQQLDEGRFGENLDPFPEEAPSGGSET